MLDGGRTSPRTKQSWRQPGDRGSPHPGRSMQQFLHGVGRDDQAGWRRGQGAAASDPVAPAPGVVTVGRHEAALPPDRSGGRQCQQWALSASDVTACPTEHNGLPRGARTRGEPHGHRGTRPRGACRCPAARLPASLSGNPRARGASRAAPNFAGLKLIPVHPSSCTAIRVQACWIYGY